jgi:hypothetical protein
MVWGSSESRNLERRVYFFYFLTGVCLGSWE